MNKQIRRITFIFLAAVFVGSGMLALRQVCYNSAAENAYQQAQDISSAEPAPEEPVTPPEEELPPVVEEEDPYSKEPLDESLRFLLEMDLEELRQTNADVLGWIHIPDTQLSYPLLQAEDNQTYLNKTWDGVNNSAGSIFLECKSQPDFSDFNTLVYGHRMKNGSMFGSLRNYNKQEYLAEHPYVYITTDDRVLRYEIFSAYEASVVSDTYRLYVEDEETKQAALEHFVSSSVLDSEQVPTTEDHILTLSTCTGTGTYHSRWVVQAMLLDQWKR